MKYYPITKLQAKTPEIEEILNLLQPLSTSSAEFDNMKVTLILFMKSLRSDLGVEVEERYVDKVHLAHQQILYVFHQTHLLWQVYPIRQTFL